MFYISLYNILIYNAPGNYSLGIVIQVNVIHNCAGYTGVLLRSRPAFTIMYTLSAWRSVKPKSVPGRS